MELAADGVTLRVRAGVGWQPDVVGSVTVKAEAGSSEGYALQSGKPAISANIDTETRFQYAEFIKAAGVKALVVPSELESALLNLCINARDAMPEGGKLTIGTADAHLRAEHIGAQEEASPGDFVSISVTGTGEGMQPDVIARAFEPFFTTKPIGLGTGLGLRQVYGFVWQSSGIVQIESAPGAGTTVRLYLPRLGQAETLVEQAVSADPEQAKAGETVLLVDDEDGVREPASEYLRRLGFRVFEAADGVTALRMLDTINRLDLLVTDVGFPNGMNGRQVAEAVRQLRPGVPVLFITGFSGTTLGQGFEMVSKPFDLDTLARRIQSLIPALGPAPDARRR